MRERMDEIREEIKPIIKATSEALDMELDKKLKLEKNDMFGFFLRLSRNVKHSSFLPRSHGAGRCLHKA